MIQRLLGLDGTTAAGFSFERTFLVQAWPLALTVVAAVAALLWTAFCYRREGPRASLLYKGFLLILRMAALATLLVVLFQPMLRLQRVDVTPSHVAVLIDRSDSMRRRDRWSDPAARTRFVKAVGTPDAPALTRQATLNRVLARPDVDLLKRLKQRHEVRVYPFGDASTRIGDALSRALDDLSGEPVAGMVLLTDGGQNLGIDPLAAARRAGDLRIPIYAVGVGDPRPPRDVAVASVLMDSVVRKNDEVTVSVTVQQRGRPRATSVPVTLRRDGRVLASGEARFGAGEAGAEGEEMATASLSFIPREAGAFTIQVEAPTTPGEVSATNNRRRVPVRVVDKKLQILYLESAPRWEYRYLKNAILRDTSIQFACLLTEADPRMGGEGTRRITGFPRDIAELFRYDIVILGDLPRETLSTAQMENLRRFVQERGGSLVVIAGERFMPWEYRGTPLAELLPAVLPEQREELVTEDPFRLRLTEAGRRHPMMLLAPGVDANAKVWEGLPGLYWCGVIEKAKPGATVLATHSTRGNEYGPLPLILVQQTGEGRCFLSMVDSTWQWRYRLGDIYFYRFWGQVLRSLTPHELPGENQFARLTPDRTEYALGQRVTLRARLLTPAFQPLRAPEVRGRVRRDDGTTTEIRFLPRPGAAGLYEATLQPPRAGTYDVSLRGATSRFSVEAVAPEMEKPELNEALLRRIAAESGGSVVPLGDLASLPGRLRDASVRVTSTTEHELWDTPLSLTLFALFLVGEWTLRKRKGML